VEAILSEWNWEALGLWAVVVSYVAFVFTKGVLKARRVHNSDDFLVAGRNVGWFFLFCTMGATVIGGGASIGAIGRTYEWGLLMLLVSTGWYLHFIISGLLVAPQFRKAELYTVVGYFGLRFGEGPRFVVLVLSLLFSVFIVAAQMAAFGTVLSAILPQLGNADLILKLSILVGGALVIIYSTAGGLLAVIHTDVYQFVILLLGFAITMLLCLPDVLSLGSEVAGIVPAAFFHPHGGYGWLFLVTTFLAFFLGETFAPGYATRYCVGKNISETKRGIAGVGFFLALVFPAILFVIALFARIHHPGIEPQQALPLVIKQLNNPLVGGLIVGALLMAVMSSADSALNSATAIFVKDLFEHQLGWFRGDDSKKLKAARLSTALLGGLSILIAVLWSDIIGLLLVTYHLWAPAIIIPVLVGAVSKTRSRTLNANILFAMLAATALSLCYVLLPLAREHLGVALLPTQVYDLIGQVDAAVFGVAACAMVFLGSSLVSRIWGKPSIGQDP